MKRESEIFHTLLLNISPIKVNEYDAISDILEPLNTNTKEETLKLFNEFEDAKTVEARFVKAIDKLEMLVTAAEYEKAGFSGLTDFWENPFTFKVFEEFEPLAQYAQYLLNKRKQRVNGEL
ncbi:MAG: HD domain-containing protein [Candidatus Riflebacteria bacterium]|nr:HD domain-containing protein [Candidatus Riflebacteria bacterium]